MKTYNSKQKSLIYIAIAIFILVNLVSVVLAIVKFNAPDVKGISTGATDYFVDGRIINENFSQSVNILSKTEPVLIDNDSAQILMIAHSEVQYLEPNTFQAARGFVYVEAKQDLIISNVELPQSSRILVDPIENRVYVLRGSVKFHEQEIKKGNIIDLQTLDIIPLNKAELLETNKAKEINDSLLSFALFVNELNVNSQPTIASLNIENNMMVTEWTLPITGKTEGENELYLNNQLVSVNTDGRFFVEIELGLGINVVELRAVDSNANSTIQTLIVNKV